MKMPSNKKIYKSKTVIGLVLGLALAVVLPRLGWELPEAYSNDIWAALTAFIIFGLRDAQGKLEIMPKKDTGETTNGAG
jgi:CDP-diglyceride synthetase